MTSIDKLEAGRELDAIVAAKLMGIKDPCSCDLADYTNDECNRCGKTFCDWYSTQIAAAWEVVKKVGELRDGPNKIYKPVIRMEYYEHDGIATVSVGRCKSMDEVVASAQVWEEHGEANADQAMALAICRAALKAVGA